jgi:hypothetical protein
MFNYLCKQLFSLLSFMDSDDDELAGGDRVMCRVSKRGSEEWEFK